MTKWSKPETISEAKKVDISHNTRKSSKALFQNDPYSMIKEAINNTVEDAMANNTHPVLRIELRKDIGFAKNGLLVFKDEGSGLNFDEFLDYGNSKKKRTIGRFGQGFKDACLEYGECLLARSPEKSIKLFETVDKSGNLNLFWEDTKHIKMKDGTLFAIVLKKGTKFEMKDGKKRLKGAEAIEVFVQEYAGLALYWDNIVIYVSGKKVKPKYKNENVVEVNIPSGRNKFAKGLLLEEGTGVDLFTQGGYLLQETQINTYQKLLVNYEGFLNEEKTLGPTKRINTRNKIYKTFEPRLMKFIEECGIGKIDDDKILRKELEELEEWLNTAHHLGGTGNPGKGEGEYPLLINQEEVEEEKKKEETLEKKDVDEKDKELTKGGGYKKRGGIKVVPIHRSELKIYIGVLGNQITLNKAHKIHKLLMKISKPKRRLYHYLTANNRAVWLGHDNDEDLNLKLEDWRKEDASVLKNLSEVLGLE